MEMHGADVRYRESSSGFVSAGTKFGATPGPFWTPISTSGGSVTGDVSISGKQKVPARQARLFGT